MQTKLYKAVPISPDHPAGVEETVAATDHERDVLISQGWSLTLPGVAGVPDPGSEPVPEPEAAPQLTLEGLHARLTAVEAVLRINAPPPRTQAEHATLMAKHTQDITDANAKRNQLAVEAATTGIAATPAGLNLPAIRSGLVTTDGLAFKVVSGDSIPAGTKSININGADYTVTAIKPDGLSGLLAESAGEQNSVPYKVV